MVVLERQYGGMTKRVELLLSVIVSLTCGYFVAVETQDYPAISWWYTNQTVFSSSESASGIQILDRLGARVNSNIYAINLSVKNSGTLLLDNMNIGGSLVRSPLIVSIKNLQGPTDRLLSASIVSSDINTPKNLVCSLSHDKASIVWDHFDPGSEFRVDLLYAASEQHIPGLDVKIAKMNKPEEFKLAAPRYVQPSIGESSFFVPFALMFFGLALIIINVMIFIFHAATLGLSLICRTYRRA